MAKRAPNPKPLTGPPKGLSGEALSRWVVEVCTRAESDGGLGFTLAGVCRVEPPPREDVRALERWLAEGMHGEMGYMAEQMAERLEPERLLARVRSAVMVADRYSERDSGVDVAAVAERSDGVARGRVARYARGRDYHQTIKRRLHRLADALRLWGTDEGVECRSFVDTAPVLERRSAQRAGLGWLAKNGMLIHPVEGSYLLLGGFLTTLDLPALADREPMVDHCGTCRRCIDACPTGAINDQPLSGGDDPRPRVDGSRCVSYLTIEHAGEIAPVLTSGMGDWVFGCDVCQEVCPHNSARPEGSAAGRSGGVRGEYAPYRATVPLAEMTAWASGDRSLLSVSAMKRASVEMLRRNARIALQNHGHA